MSLSYYDQHLFWQQRVVKEISAASKFYENNDVYKLKSISTNSFQKKTHHSRPSHMRSSVQAHPYQSDPIPYLYSNDYRTTNVYAEVRGKYARPPPPLAKPPEAIQSTLFTPNEIKLISRPSTSGNYRPKRSKTPTVSLSHSHIEPKPIDIKSAKNYESIENLTHKKVVPFENDGKAYKIRSGRSSLTRTRSSNRSISQKSGEEQIIIMTEPCENIEEKEDKKEEEAEKSKEEEKKSEEEKIGEGIKNEENVKNDEKDNISNASWITTSSHKRYIEELEEMLKAEKIKRIHAEEELKRLAKSQQAKS
ncbi:unnamed protein product [Blepharisma stoltei]|uniref:Uncharacterized protein n=1 Tax=Blepharisma stoltei TaxID=1481888 RepID=A0AAU9IWL5_9CILI|nr:unnamed protein product [Blepharisma stoltei]